MQPTIGIAIATFNSADIIDFCLAPLADQGFVVVLFDDASKDETVEKARSICPAIHVMHGDGDCWWAGGTRRAVEKCFSLGCDYVLMLNPDVRIAAEDVRELAEYAQRHPNTIPAALVVQRGREQRVAWAGSRFEKLCPGVPVFTSRYIAKRGVHVSELGQVPYPSDEAHGRGVLLSRTIVEQIGMLDDETFPHYGADNDYSMRARNRSIDIVILPTVRAVLEVEKTGQHGRFDDLSTAQRLQAARDYLFERKNGEALRVKWQLYRRHVPAHAVPGSFLFNVALNLYRRFV